MRECWREIAPALAFLTLLMLASGILLHTCGPSGRDRAGLIAAYVPWGVFQQTPQRLFSDRLRAGDGRRAASLVAAALSAAFTPQLVSDAGGLSRRLLLDSLYRRYRNLLHSGLAHATVGFLLFLVSRIPSATISRLGRAGLGTDSHRLVIRTETFLSMLGHMRPYACDNQEQICRCDLCTRRVRTVLADLPTPPRRTTTLAGRT